MLDSASTSEAQLRAWQRFVGLLEAEREALIANDAERVAMLAAEKIALAQTLARVSSSAPAELTTLVASARNLNQVNDALLRQRLAQVRQASAVLGLQSVTDTQGYGPDGRAPRRGANTRGFTAA